MSCFSMMASSLFLKLSVELAVTVSSGRAFQILTILMELLLIGASTRKQQQQHRPLIEGGCQN